MEGTGEQPASLKIRLKDDSLERIWKKHQAELSKTGVEKERLEQFLNVGRLAAPYETAVNLVLMGCKVSDDLRETLQTYYRAFQALGRIEVLSAIRQNALAGTAASQKVLFEIFEVSDQLEDYTGEGFEVIDDIVTVEDGQTVILESYQIEIDSEGNEIQVPLSKPERIRKGFRVGEPRKFSRFFDGVDPEG